MCIIIGVYSVSLTNNNNDDKEQAAPECCARNGRPRRCGKWCPPSQPLPPPPRGPKRGRTFFARFRRLSKRGGAIGASSVEQTGVCMAIVCASKTKSALSPESLYILLKYNILQHVLSWHDALLRNAISGRHRFCIAYYNTVLGTIRMI